MKSSAVLRAGDIHRQVTALSYRVSRELTQVSTYVEIRLFSEIQDPLRDNLRWQLEVKLERQFYGRD